jgi:hypothetical protein
MRVSELRREGFKISIDEDEEHEFDGEEFYAGNDGEIEPIVPHTSRTTSVASEKSAPTRANSRRGPAPSSWRSVLGLIGVSVIIGVGVGAWACARDSSDGGVQFRGSDANMQEERLARVAGAREWLEDGDTRLE